MLSGRLWDKIRRKMNINNKTLKISIIIILISTLFYPSISAEKYYADIQISIDSSGFVDIEGISDYSNLIVQNSNLYTYKKQSYWVFNLTKNVEFSDYFFKLTLPEDAKINYIKTSGLLGIEEESGNIVISGAGKNEELSILVQYQLEPNEYQEMLTDQIIYLFLGIIIFILVVLLIYNIMKSQAKSAKKINNEFKGLNKRQKDIMTLLIKSKRPLTQSEIKKELKLPKSAVSRNIHSLEIKGLIEIEKIGMSNLIRIKKQ